MEMRPLRADFVSGLLLSLGCGSVQVASIDWLNVVDGTRCEGGTAPTAGDDAIFTTGGLI